MATILTDRPVPPRHATAIAQLERLRDRLERERDALASTMARDADRGVAPTRWQYDELESLVDQITEVEHNIETVRSLD